MEKIFAMHFMLTHHLHPLVLEQVMKEVLCLQLLMLQWSNYNYSRDVVVEAGILYG